MLLDLIVHREGPDVHVSGLPNGWFLQSIDVDEPIYDLDLLPPSWDAACEMQGQWKTDPKVHLTLGDHMIDGFSTSIALGFGLCGNHVYLRVIDRQQASHDPRDESISTLHAP